ncbi:unnamed protein product [Dracunculus medinensis]|uniref:Biogenesis of lysosome-related organelles complex 1 subunit 7 n=1 Tax=Dracunculus medinensis TaxID=318479 RepID=A0A0N4U5Z0_DRAME|nr:unnamed protein product [Dracunculus medinensis]
MSVMAVVDRVRLVAEQIFDHTDLVEANDVSFDSLLARDDLKRLNSQIKEKAAAIIALTTPTFKKEHDDYLERIKQLQNNQLLAVDMEIEQQLKNLRETIKQGRTVDDLPSPEVSASSEVDLE